ncbi:MAG: hypothetical protein IJ689_04495 [Alphaproteobacteria bacterium]|nr:hypothetical protein [Alphaproteobacteria bacterium]
MKKFGLLALGLSMFLSACSTCATCHDGKCDRFLALGCNAKAAPAAIVAPAVVAPAVAASREVVTPSVQTSNQVRYYVVEQDTSCISESAVIKAPLVDKNVKVNENDYRSFARRVAIKGQSDNFITYEYRDIRVDELMPLAAHYCREHGDRTAVLRKINLHHGYYRRVTFDCVRL